MLADVVVWFVVACVSAGVGIAAWETLIDRTPDPTTTTTVTVLFLEWHELDDGLWCDQCALPSCRRLALVETGHLQWAATVTVCDDCGQVEQERQ